MTQREERLAKLLDSGRKGYGMTVQATDVSILLRYAVGLEAENERLVEFREKLVDDLHAISLHKQEAIIRAEQAEAHARDLEAERTLAVKARDNWREAHDQAQARTRTLEVAIEGNTFCECFDEYGRKRPTPCWRCAALTEPTPPKEEQG